MAEVVIDPDGVIALSAATVASGELLDGDALALARTMSQVEHLVPYPPQVRARVATIASGLTALSGWAHGLAVDYADHEAPVRELGTLGFWMPDLGALGWDTSQTASQNIDRISRSDEFGAGPIGLSAALLDRYRHWSLAIPKLGSADAVANIGRAALGELAEQQVFARDVIGRLECVLTPSGLWVPAGGAADPGLAVGARVIGDNSLPDNFTEAGSRGLSWDPALGSPPAWARTAGRGLFWAGSALAVYDAGASQWDHDAQYHPEWSTTQRVVDAGATATVVGGSVAVGAWAGAEVGAEAGAFLGSFVPVPVVGTIVGGLVGGLIGGFVGSEVGRAVGTGLKEGAEALWDGLFG